MVRIQEERERIQRLRDELEETESSKRKYMLTQEIKRRERDLKTALRFLKEANK